jgi:hypothetical protein
MPSLAEGNRLAVCYFPHATGEPASFPTSVKVIMTSFVTRDVRITGDATVGWDGYRQKFSCRYRIIADTLESYEASADHLQRSYKGNSRRKGEGSPDHTAMQQAHPPR